MSTLYHATHHPWNARHEDERDETSSSLFSSTQDATPTANNNNTNAVTANPEPPAHFLRDNDESALQHTEWTSDDIIMIVILPILLTILFGFSLRHCYVANRRHAQFHERRLNVRAAQRAETREQRRLKDKNRKERGKEIEKALITKTASKCKCNTSSSTKRPFGSMSDITMHTNVTDDMSISSSSHDTENPAAAVVDDIDDDETLSSQTCAICLEPYIAGKDKVSWSKFQTCRHAFHQKCIEGWLAQTKNKDGSCPCCRGPYLREENIEDKKTEENVQPLEEEDGSNNVDVEMQDSTNVVQTPEEERNVDEERLGDTNVQPLDQEGHTVDGGVATTFMLEGNNPSTTSKTKNNMMGSEFTSFCIVHGLKRDKKRGGNAFLSIQSIDDEPTTGSLENV